MRLLPAQAPASADVRIRVLGPLEVAVAGRPVGLRPGQPRRLLLRLVMAGGRPVSADSLLDDLWPNEQPQHPRNALQVVVSHARKALGDAAGVVETVPTGYRLAVRGADVDAVVFERLLGQATATADPLARLGAIEQALSLWGGEPYADVAYDSFAQAEIQRLRELRVGAEESHAETLLELGRHSDAVSLLSALADAHPLHERFHSLLMTALYRAGRQADALRRYDAVRAVLLDELGLDPGPELRAVAQAVLEQSPVLDWTPPAQPAAAPRRLTAVEACA